MKKRLTKKVRCEMDLGEFLERLELDSFFQRVSDEMSRKEKKEVVKKMLLQQLEAIAASDDSDKDIAQDEIIFREIIADADEIYNFRGDGWAAFVEQEKRRWRIE